MRARAKLEWIFAASLEASSVVRACERSNYATVQRLRYIYIYLYNLQYVCFTSRLLLASDASIPFDDILGLLFFRGIDLLFCVVETFRKIWFRYRSCL